MINLNKKIFNAQIVILSEDESARHLLRDFSQQKHLRHSLASDFKECENILLQSDEKYLLFLDVDLGFEKCIDFFQMAKERYPDLNIVLLSSQTDNAKILKSLELRASGFLEKPIQGPTLEKVYQSNTAHHQKFLKQRNDWARIDARIKRMEKSGDDRGWYLTKSTYLHFLNEKIRNLRLESMRGAVELNVLIKGEVGTEKEEFAKIIHSGSRRAKGPWIVVNCAGIHDQGTELFGPISEPTTGEPTTTRTEKPPLSLIDLSSGGTLVLERIDRLSPDLQLRLLKTLELLQSTQSQDLGIRIVSTAINTATINPVLFEKISQVLLEIPALRDRQNDILSVSLHLADTAFYAQGKVFCGFTHEVEEFFSCYSWPGNLHELQLLLNRVALLWEGNAPVSIRALTLNPPLPSHVSSNHLNHRESQHKLDISSISDADFESYTSLKKDWSNAFEKEFIRTTLKKSSGNVSAAARTAKLDRSNFLRLLRRHGIKASDFRKVAA